MGETKMPLPIMVPTINEIPLNRPDVDVVDYDDDDDVDAEQARC